MGFKSFPQEKLLTLMGAGTVRKNVKILVEGFPDFLRPPYSWLLT
jgi:hypothetical protein